MCPTELFTAPKLEDYTKPAQPVTKTISAADHTVTFTYKGEAKPEFDFEGKGLTARTFFISVLTLFE